MSKNPYSHKSVVYWPRLRQLEAFSGLSEAQISTAVSECLSTHKVSKKHKLLGICGTCLIKTHVESRGGVSVAEVDSGKKADKGKWL